MTDRTWRETHEKSWNRWLDRQRPMPEIITQIDFDRVSYWLKVIYFTLFLLGIILAKAMKP